MSRTLWTRATLVLSLTAGILPLAAIGVIPTAYAQNATTGALTGVITDSTGAVVPNAQVTITDTATGARITLTTNAEGRYTANLLKPSHYKVTATAKGLAASVTTVNILVGQTPNLDLTVTPNGANTTVTVSAQTAELTDTQSPGSLTTLTEQQIQSLPAPGGDITTVAYTAPGVVVNTGGSYGNFNVNGLPGVSNLFVLNGADDEDPFLNLNNSGSSNLTLGLQEISEATTVVNGYEAQYGRQAGAILEWTTKSGTNQFHGAATYFYNGTVLNANDYFAKQEGEARPHDVANQWGANIGGPILKNKLFFFTDYEGDRYVTPNVGTAAFPSPQLEAYTLSHVPASSLPYYQQLFNIYNSSPNYARATPVITGNGATQDQTGTLGCGPNFAGTSDGAADTFGTNIPCAVATEGQANNLNNEWLYTARVDWNISDKQKLFGRFMMDHGTQPTYTSFVSPTFDATSVQPFYTGQLNHTYAFTPNIANQFIFSADWYTAYFGPSSIPNTLAALPIYIALSDGGTNSGTWGQAGMTPGFPQGRNVTLYQFVDDLSIVKGNNNFRFGYNFRRADVSDYDAQAGEYGAYAFHNLNDFANGTLSNESTYAQAFPTQGTGYIALYNLGAYLQDEWQARPNLKLTLAVRFDRNGNPLCNNDCFARYNGVFPEAGVDTTAPYSNSAYDTAVLANQAHPFANIESVVFQPRFGFNYDVYGNGHTVVRGGVGIFEDNPASIYVDGFLENFPQYYGANVASGTVAGSASVLGSGPGNALASNQVLQAGFPAGLTPNQAASAVAATGATFATPNLTAGPANFRTPKYVEFNLQVQQQISKSDAIFIGYAGNTGYDEFLYNRNINGSYAALGTPFGDLPAVSPDPRFAAVSQISNSGHSNYNGLQIGYRHIDNRGLTININYTYAHSLDDVSNAGEPGTPTNGDAITSQIDPYHLRALNYSNSDYDVRHSVNGDVTYQEHWKAHNYALNELLGGWLISGKGYWHTGEPFSVINSTLPGAVGGTSMSGTVLAAAIDPATISRSCLNPSNCSVTAAQFQTTATQTTFGNLPRNSFRGPRYGNIDLVLSKQLATWRSVNFQVGANAFNVMNHPNFSLPSDNVVSGIAIGSIAGPPTSPYGDDASGVGGRILQVFGKFNF